MDKRWDRAWARYMDALRKHDAAKHHPDGRVRYGARRSVRAARLALEQIDGGLLARLERTNG